MRNRIKARDILKDSKEIVFKGTSLEVHTKEINGVFYLQIFEGRKLRPSMYAKFNSFSGMEKQIKRFVDKDLKNKAYKEEIKKKRKEAISNLKHELQKGVTVRSSFSYDMTFNYFFRVVSNKGNTYKFEILNKEWVDGDAGYTGSVKAGSPTGKFIEGKITSSGLKIDDNYARVINPLESFYENHCD